MAVAATYQTEEARMKFPVITHDVAGAHRAIFRRKASTFPLNAEESIDMGILPKGAIPLSCEILIISGAVDDALADVDVGLFDTYDQATYHADEDGLIDGGALNAVLGCKNAYATTEIQIGVVLDWDCYVRLEPHTQDMDDTLDILVIIDYYWEIPQDVPA